VIILPLYWDLVCKTDLLSASFAEFSEALAKNSSMKCGILVQSTSKLNSRSDAAVHRLHIHLNAWTQHLFMHNFMSFTIDLQLARPYTWTLAVCFIAGKSVRPTPISRQAAIRLYTLNNLTPIVAHRSARFGLDWRSMYLCIETWFSR
jgi:hypothetical protein